MQIPCIYYTYSLPSKFELLQQGGMDSCLSKEHSCNHLQLYSGFKSDCQFNFPNKYQP